MLAPFPDRADEPPGPDFIRGTATCHGAAFRSVSLPATPQAMDGLATNDNLKASMAPEELRRHMRALGYRTQAELAQAIGVSRSAVSLWLEGKIGVPRPVAMLLRMLVRAQRRVY
jgi:DNA-binding XRE family transcriptional regulator